MASDVHWDEDVEILRDLARESLGDPRIANYFSRDHVKASDVLGILDDDDLYQECRTSDSYEQYAANRHEVDKLNTQMSAAVKDGSINWKTVFISVVILVFGLLLFSEFGEKVHPGYKILLTVFSAGAACGAGYLAGLRARFPESSALIVVAALILLILSLCSIILPLSFAVFPWNPIWIYINLVDALGVGALLSELKTARDSQHLAVALSQALVCLYGWRERRKHKKTWLEDSLAEVIYPNTVLAINRLLGEDSTKLLVEQHSEGLRRLQDPKFTVSTRSEQRLLSLIAGMDGGSIAITGPRGAGKSTLLRRVCNLRDSSAQERFCLYIPAPAEYVVSEFLTELFQQVCDLYLERYGSPVAEMRYRGLRTQQDALRVARGAVGILRLVLRFLFMLALLAVAFVPLIVGVHPTAAVSHIPVGHWRGELVRYTEEVWRKYHVIIQVASGILACFWWPYKSVRLRRLRVLWRPKLIRRARDYSIHLKIERTRSWGASLGIPAMRGTSLSVNKGISEKYVPWTLPEMVGKLRNFLAEMSQPSGGSLAAVIIGIDEIDRIGSVEQAERFIGEIKAIFGIPNCFFLVSVAEDAGFLFSRQSIVGHSTLEHSFDGMVVVEALELDEARKLLSTRVPGFTDSFVFLALALSGGLPREMITVARRLVEVNHREANGKPAPKIGDLALRVAAENIAEVLRTSRTQLARLALPGSWGDVFCQLRDAVVLLRSESASPDKFQKAIGLLCTLRSPDATAAQTTSQETDEAVAAKIIGGLAAFACYTVTVIEAFDNDYFSLRNARRSTRNAAGGSYTELAAARLELSISPESSQLIIRRFRAHAGLPPLPLDHLLIFN